MNVGAGIMNGVQINRKLRRSMIHDDVVVCSVQDELLQRTTCENKVLHIFGENLKDWKGLVDCIKSVHILKGDWCSIRVVFLKDSGGAEIGILQNNGKPDQVVQALEELSDLAHIQKIELGFGLTPSDKKLTLKAAWELVIPSLEFTVTFAEELRLLKFVNIPCSAANVMMLWQNAEKGTDEVVEHVTDELKVNQAHSSVRSKGIKEAIPEAASASKHSLSEYFIQAFELREKVSRVEILHNKRTISNLKKTNIALKKKLALTKAQLQTAVKHSMQARFMVRALKEVKAELEFCLADRDEYAQEVHMLKCENARLVASMVDYEVIKNKWEVAQVQLLQARVERDNYKEKSMELNIKLLQETEARMAADRERQMLLKDYEALQKAYKELKAEKRSLLEDQAYQLDSFHTRLSVLQSEVKAVKDEYDVVKVHRDKFSSNLRQFASEHSSLQEQFMAFAKDLFEGVQAKMGTSIDEYERLETAQDTVAEHVQATTAQSKAMENELRKLERETERYRCKLKDVRIPFTIDMLTAYVPNMAEKWRDLGLRLGLDACVIRAVEVKHHTSEGCCQEVISRWREGSGKIPKTWVTILEAMRLCGLTKVAKDVEESLCLS